MNKEDMELSTAVDLFITPIIRGKLMPGPTNQNEPEEELFRGRLKWEEWEREDLDQLGIPRSQSVISFGLGGRPRPRPEPEKKRSRTGTKWPGPESKKSSTIEEIVNQFYSGTKEGPARASEIYKETIFDAEGGYREDYAYTGTVIPNERLEFDRQDADRLDGFITEERICDLEDGTEPTEKEKHEYRRSVIAQAEHGSADYYPVYFLYELRHTDGREVLALETVVGYSFSGVKNTFHGLFSSVDDALKYLSTWAFVVRQVAHWPRQPNCGPGQEALELLEYVCNENEKEVKHLAPK